MRHFKLQRRIGKQWCDIAYINPIVHDEWLDVFARSTLIRLVPCEPEYNRYGETIGLVSLSLL